MAEKSNFSSIMSMCKNSTVSPITNQSTARRSLPSRSHTRSTTEVNPRVVLSGSCHDFCKYGTHSSKPKTESNSGPDKKGIKKVAVADKRVKPTLAVDTGCSFRKHTRTSLDSSKKGHDRASGRPGKVVADKRVKPTVAVDTGCSFRKYTRTSLDSSKKRFNPPPSSKSAQVKPVSASVELQAQPDLSEPWAAPVEFEKEGKVAVKNELEIALSLKGEETRGLMPLSPIPTNKAPQSRKSRVIEKEEESRRLVFRKGMGMVMEKKKEEEMRRVAFRKVKEKDDGGKKEDAAEKVNLKHQEVQEKKKSEGLLNSVIKETASKLRKTRKGKVKVLVEAFETVMSVQHKKV